MITINDITFSESCCGGHVFMSEVIRNDKIGFLIERKGENGLYSVKKYAADHIALLESKNKLTEAALIEYINN